MNVATESSTALEFDKIRGLIADRTVSSWGREEIESLDSVADLDAIQERMRPVVEAIDLLRFDDPLSIHALPDIRRSLRTSEIPGSTLSVRELLDVGEILRSARALETYLADRSEKYPALCAHTEGLTSVPSLEEELARALEASTETVKDSASAELRRIRRGIESARDGIRKQVDAVLGRLPDDVVQDRLVTLRGGRFVIPVRENQRHRVKGMVHDQSSSGATLFIEPMVTVELNNKLRQLELAAEREVKRILKALTGQVAEASEMLAWNVEMLGRFDAAHAKASLCRDLDCTPPDFNTDGRVVLRGARHPLLMRRLTDGDESEALVPLDITLGDEDGCTLVLTGPNAGGKTVALKTVGLLALMAQAGLPVPAQLHSELPVFSGIFADIGDAQSIENDLSTFSSHVQNLVRICRHADARSLVLLDEVGASTDPDQGAALAMALLKSLTDRGTRTIATTHHGALKAFAHATPNVMNGSMTFDAATLRPTYRLRLKIPGSSYAFEIARRLEMPQDIVDEARRIAGSDVGRVESLIADLDETYEAYREELDHASRDREETQALQADYELRLGEVKKRERELKRSAQQEAQRILNDANALIERTVRQIRERGADTASIRQAHDEVRSSRQALSEALSVPQDTESTQPLKAGDRVWVQNFEKEGIVVDARRSAGRALVEMGKVRVEISLEDLEPLASKPSPAEPARKKAGVGLSRSREVSPEVDLRGLTSEEAIDVVDKYVDDLYVARMEHATIIHGKGTGALRKAVGQFLKNHAFIKSQRLGGMSEGGNGVTVVTLDIAR